MEHQGNHTNHSNHSIRSHQSQHSGHGGMEHPGHQQEQSGEDHGDHHRHMAEDFRRRFFFSLILMVPILALSPMIRHWTGLNTVFPGDRLVLAGLSTLLLIYGGKPFITGAAGELSRKSPSMMTLISLAILTSYLYSTAVVLWLGGMDFYWELATLIVIMLLGHWIEMKSVLGASGALEELTRLLPEVAHRKEPDGTLMDVDPGELKPGDLVLIRPGESVPMDGVVREGESHLDESMITGESVPVRRSAGDPLTGGAINGEGALWMEVEKTGEDTFLSQVIRLVREAGKNKTATESLADSAARWLFYLATGAGLLTLVVWLASGYPPAFAVERMVTVIIISCPHALGLAIPLVTSVSTSLGARRGLLIRNRPAFEKARNLKAVVFDKTGTLTEGSYGVTTLETAEGTREDLLRLAASVESSSEHPIARGILREAARQKLEPLPVTDFRNLTGQGAEGRVDGSLIRIVSPGSLTELGLADPFSRDGQDTQEMGGDTLVYVAAESRVLGRIRLADRIRTGVREAVDALNALGIRSIMITGDTRGAAENVAAKLRIQEVHAGVLPGDKARLIHEIRDREGLVAMTGDGVNDAPALASADMGIAVGAGTRVAMETADVVLVSDDPRDVVSLIRLSRITYRKMIENLIWATAYNLVALPLAAGVLYRQGIMVSPALGAVLMSLSTVVVAVNARMLSRKEKTL